MSWWIASLVVLSSLARVDAFAYAPNFITKIIEDQTGIKPNGLLEVKDDGEEVAAVTAAPRATAVLEKEIQVRTRFPPEPNGYLHLGHAKAVSFNFAVSRAFGGVCHMRLDDTNPSKEDREYVDSILEDVRWIQDGLYDGQDCPWEGSVRKTSDYFDEIYESAVALIKSGDAYVDSLSAEEMREYRGTLTEPGKDSPYRNRSIEENLELFEGMRRGDFPEGAHVLRAKIDMTSPNINMRDPALYRIKHESHQETGDAWCIYPMYDFSHPISDALEGITHRCTCCDYRFSLPLSIGCVNTRPFYVRWHSCSRLWAFVQIAIGQAHPTCFFFIGTQDWTIEKLLPTGIITATPQQIEFSRLNIKSTVLSKRKLIQLVQDNVVSGWDDPRMPTLSGLRRRGIPPAALRLFCERMGISKADSFIDYGVLEDCVREVMDDTTPRAFCVVDPLKVTITNWEGGLEEFTVDRHPKLDEMGQRNIRFGGEVYIERSDFFDTDGPEGQTSGGKAPAGFKRLLPDCRVRLRYAYVIELNEIIRDPETQEPVELKATYVPETRAGFTPTDMKPRPGIIHWVEASTAVKCQINQYDRLFVTEEPGKESGDFLQDMNPDSLQVIKDAVVEPSVAEDVAKKLKEVAESTSAAKKVYPSSLSYQFERNGYFALDKDSADAENLIFNRVVTLRDAFVDKKGQNEGRKRGGQKQQEQKKSNEPVEDLRRVAFRVGTILSAEPHPEADSLLVCQVDCGDGENGSSEPRTVVAGLAGKIPIGELVGQKVVTVTNLKPAKMRGIESMAMLLAASGDSDETVELLQVPEGVPNGELISFEGKEESEPDAMMKSKGALKAWERVRDCLKVNGEGQACYDNEGSMHHMKTSKGPVSIKSLRDVPIQ
eukprot:scaffold426_cov219-Amphora_coffeaeformis.AAC.1